MRFLALTILALAIALGGGAWSAALMLTRFEGAGALIIGPWHADRLAGSPTADPYSRARAAREGNLSLGLGEGVAFRAAVDSNGRLLSRNCVYRITGQVPQARVYTLAAYERAGRLTGTDPALPFFLTSTSLMRDDSNAAPVTVSRRAAAGNWLALSGEGAFILALTLYDTPVSTSTGAGALSMPAIARGECASG